MDSKILLIFFVIALGLPTVNAQIAVSSHNITYELLEGKVLVQETILFVNPEKSEVHTFNEEIALLRGSTTDMVITGVPGLINNVSSPNIITLDFSHSPIFRTAAQNTREVTLTYSTREFTSEGLFDGEDRFYSFIGNILPTFPSDLEIDTTSITIKSGDGFQMGAALPETEIVDDRVSFFISADDRKNNAAFNVNVQYARFTDLANSNIESVQIRLDVAEEKAEDARTAILDSSLYDANTSKAESDLNKSLNLINESKFNLAFAEAFMQSNSYYDAYRVSTTSANMLEAAIQAATDAKREANLQLTIAWNEKFSQLENRTSATATPPPTTSPVETKPPVETEVPVTPAPPRPTPPTVPPVEAEDTTQDGGLSLEIIAGVIVIAIAAIIFVSSRGKKNKDHQAAVKDFRSISDLKRKSYKDFEEKLEDVKKDTDTAGEIRRLSAEKKKYVLGVENLIKKKLSGEVTERVYKSERGRYETEIRKLEKKIKILEEELPKKGGFDG
jgi:gas vesicle protein